MGILDGSQTYGQPSGYDFHREIRRDTKSDGCQGMKWEYQGKKGGDIIYCNSQNKFQHWLLDVIRQTHVGESTTNMGIDLIQMYAHNQEKQEY